MVFSVRSLIFIFVFPTVFYTANLKDIYSEHLYTFHLDSTSIHHYSFVILYQSKLVSINEYTFGVHLNYRLHYLLKYLLSALLSFIVKYIYI